MCRDVRSVDGSAEGRNRAHPKYHLFTQDMAEIGFTQFYDDRSLASTDATIADGMIAIE